MGAVRRRSAVRGIALDRSRCTRVLARRRAAGLLVVVPFALIGCGESEKTTDAASPTTASITAPSVLNTGQRPRHRRRPTRLRGPSGSACRAPKDVLAGVYHPERLEVLAPCRLAAGTVRRISHEPDGDLHVEVALETPYSALLDEVNRTQKRGRLVVEFMPRDGGHLPEPGDGEHVRLTGAWVDDTEHGWNELHPVWSVQINGGAVHRSGPQYGGSPPYDRSFDAAAGCRDQHGGPCKGYGGTSSTRTYGRGYGSGGSREA